MTEWLQAFERAAVPVFWVGVGLAFSMLTALVIERLIYAYELARAERLERRYQPLVQRALDGDDAARRELVASPRRHLLTIASLVIVPLISDRDPVRIARSRELAQAMPLRRIAERFLRSPWWWRRAIALRAAGLLQLTKRTAHIVAALDDSNADVRAAALDALSDLKNPDSIPAIVVRMHDASLHRGRRAEALAAFGSGCEGFILELARSHPEHRLNYARALALCGTAQSRATLCQWTADASPAVRAAAFEALARVGLDERAAALALAALSRDDVAVRAMAAHALQGWSNAVATLGHHLGDTWPVAVQSARSLRSMHDAGLHELRIQSQRSDIAGLLARQMLWEESYQ